MTDVDAAATEGTTESNSAAEADAAAATTEGTTAEVIVTEEQTTTPAETAPITVVPTAEAQSAKTAPVAPPVTPVPGDEVVGPAVDTPAVPSVLQQAIEQYKAQLIGAEAMKDDQAQQATVDVDSPSK